MSLDDGHFSEVVIPAKRALPRETHRYHSARGQARATWRQTCTPHGDAASIVSEAAVDVPARKSLQLPATHRIPPPYSLPRERGRARRNVEQGPLWGCNREGAH